MYVLLPVLFGTRIKIIMKVLSVSEVKPFCRKCAVNIDVGAPINK